MAARVSGGHSNGHVITVQMTRQGQVPVPKALRQRLHLSAGTTVAIVELGSGLLLLPEQPDFEVVCERIRQALAETGRTEQEILTTLPDARQQVFEELYGPADEYESP